MQFSAIQPIQLFPAEPDVRPYSHNLPFLPRFYQFSHPNPQGSPPFFPSFFTIGSMMSHLPSMYPIHPYTESKSEIFFSVFFHRITSLQKDLYYIYHPLQTIRTKTSYNGFSILLKYKWRKRAAFCEKTYNVKNCSTSWGPVENSGRFTRKKKGSG